MVSIASLLAFTGRVSGVSIVSIDAPPDLNPSGSTTVPGGSALSVSVPPYPFPITVGFGTIVNPDYEELGAPNFVVHNSGHYWDQIPDQETSRITFGFDAPTIVRRVEIVQHANGVSALAAAAGSDLATLTPLGSTFGPNGDVGGFGAFTEGELYSFDFSDNNVSGTIFEVTIAKTSLINGYAFYRMFLYDEHDQRIEGAVVPEPQWHAMVLGSLGLAWALARRKGDAKTTPTR